MHSYQWVIYVEVWISRLCWTASQCVLLVYIVIGYVNLSGTGAHAHGALRCCASADVLAKQFRTFYTCQHCDELPNDVGAGHVLRTSSTRSISTSRLRRRELPHPRLCVTMLAHRPYFTPFQTAPPASEARSDRVR